MDSASKNDDRIDPTLGYNRGLEQLQQPTPGSSPALAKRNRSQSKDKEQKTIVSALGYDPNLWEFTRVDFQVGSNSQTLCSVIEQLKDLVLLMRGEFEKIAVPNPIPIETFEVLASMRSCYSQIERLVEHHLFHKLGNNEYAFSHQIDDYACLSVRQKWHQLRREAIGLSRGLHLNGYSNTCGRLTGLYQSCEDSIRVIKASLDQISPSSQPQLVSTVQEAIPGGDEVTAQAPGSSGISMQRIWNTSTQKERENLKNFWLELGEDERRALVKVEKDAVLKKMKEQQKHSCSCTVCQRKRTAIEGELEGLYDAYYEELEQYANNSQGAFQNGTVLPPSRLMYHNTQYSYPNHDHPSHGRVHELPEDGDDWEDDYDEEGDDDELDDDESRSDRADFFAFWNSLTVKDGILTVSDDLLKNDGRRFINMMEQLAERRLQREEDRQYGMTAAHQAFAEGEYEDDEEDNGAYESEEDEDFEDDDMDTMTEKQRMEEGKRMFQIFAARMFEQRVLTAYREKVSHQRQEMLLQELMEEHNLNELQNKLDE